MTYTDAWTKLGFCEKGSCGRVWLWDRGPIGLANPATIAVIRLRFEWGQHRGWQSGQMERIWVLDDTVSCWVQPNKQPAQLPVRFLSRAIRSHYKICLPEVSVIYNWDHWTLAKGAGQTLDEWMNEWTNEVIGGLCSKDESLVLNLTRMGEFLKSKKKSDFGILSQSLNARENTQWILLKRMLYFICLIK